MDEPPSRTTAGPAEKDLAWGPAVLYISELLGAAIRNPDGRTLGRVKDVVARVEDSSSPVANGLLARVGGADPVFVTWERVRRIEPGEVELTQASLDSRPFERRAGEILLARDLRDKEVIHLKRKRVVRANDIALEEEGGRWRVRGVDVSAAAFLAQLGLSGIARKRMKRELILWDDVEMFTGGVPVPLHLVHDKISRLHPSDIAKIFHELGYRQSAELLECLPDSVAADVVEDLAPEYQATLLASLDRERAADILEEMPPDAAADVLNDIREDDPEVATELVSTMDKSDAEAVVSLCAYGDDTAGGLMTTDFIALSGKKTVQVAIESLRNAGDELPMQIDPIYVVAEEGSGALLGAVSLRRLLIANPGERLEDVMETGVVVRHVDDPAREVARAIAHYNLVALPILDANEQLVGVASINQAMDLILPREWLHRMPRPLIGGHSIG